MKKTFKILGSGLDLTSIEYPINLENYKFDFWATSIRSGNDHLYKLPDTGSLVVIANFTDNLSPALEGHLKQLGRTQVDLLLVPPRKDYKNLIELLNLDFISGVGIYNPESPEELEEAYNSLREIILPQYISLNLSPIEFRFDILTKIQDLNLELISFNPFGGHIDCGRCIETFSIPYLLGFSATYSSLIFLSSRDIITSQIESIYLNDLIGKESSPIYILKNNNINITKIKTKVIETSLKIGNEILRYRNPSLVFSSEDLILSLGKIEETTVLPGKIGDQFYDRFVSYIEAVCKYPEDGDDTDFISILKYKTIESLKSSLKPEEILDIIKIDSTTFIFRKTPGKYYLLTIKDHSPIFSEIPEMLL